jgi:molybdopterin molybdotransferase
MGAERDISFARARELVSYHHLSGPVDNVAIADSVGRVLAAEVTARADHPPFTNSAMDGWAIVAAGAPGVFRIAGEAAAGAPFAGTVTIGEAVAISTGAPVPAGADAIVPRERASVGGAHVEIGEPVAEGAFVRRVGEDTRYGEVVLRAGHRIGPLELAVAAGAGHATLACRVAPRVAIVVTGRELVPVGSPTATGEVWDITGVTLPALVRQAGGALVSAVAVDDDRARTDDVLGAALEVADVVVTSGGISVGDHDHVRGALEGLGVEEIFAGVRIRPGHPTWFGRRGAVRVLGLPGNPVASVVCFWVFGRPLLGLDDAWIARPLGSAYRPDTARVDIVRCIETPDGLVPAPRQASHHISSLAGATHLAAIPEGSGELHKGDRVSAVSFVG